VNVFNASPGPNGTAGSANIANGAAATPNNGASGGQAAANVLTPSSGPNGSVGTANVANGVAPAGTGTTASNDLGGVVAPAISALPSRFARLSVQAAAPAATTAGTNDVGSGVVVPNAANASLNAGTAAGTADGVSGPALASTGNANGAAPADTGAAVPSAGAAPGSLGVASGTAPAGTGTTGSGAAAGSTTASSSSSNGGGGGGGGGVAIGGYSSTGGNGDAGNANATLGERCVKVIRNPDNFRRQVLDHCRNLAERIRKRQASAR
jgi:hypothetical protein